MSSVSIAMSYLFCKIDCTKDMWQNHFANICYGIVLLAVHYTHIIWDFAEDSAALQDLKPVIIAANIDAFLCLKVFPLLILPMCLLMRMPSRKDIYVPISVSISSPKPKGDDSGIYVYICIYILLIENCVIYVNYFFSGNRRSRIQKNCKVHSFPCIDS